MASTTHPINAGSTPAAGPHSFPARRFFFPSLADFFFAALIVWLFATGQGGWYGLLSGDTGFHIRTGDWILQHNRVPSIDLFSFSKAGQAWYAWEWLADVLYSWLHGIAGLKGILALTAVVIALAGVVLFRHMIWKGAQPFAALGLTLVVFGASSVHFLARPHIFTLLGMAASVWLIDADRREHSRRILVLVPITAVWVNLHGGFLALIAMLGLLTAGVAIEALLARRAPGEALHWDETRRYGTLFAACSATTFINPYGWQLHRHVVDYLQSDWIKNHIQEFLSPSFRSENMQQFEWMLFAALMASAWLLISRRRVVEPLWILFWAHQALTSVRHVPLFLIVAAPVVAEGLTALWAAHVAGRDKRSIAGIFSNLAEDMRPACARSTFWMGAIVLLLITLPEPFLRWPNDFPEVKFPVAMIAAHEDKILSGRLLTHDDWADYLIYRNYPRQKVFVDGRSDFYGKEIGDQYFHLVEGKADWRQLLEKNGFDIILTPPGWAISSLLRLSPDWRLVAEDGEAVLFEKIHAKPWNSPVP